MKFRTHVLKPLVSVLSLWPGVALGVVFAVGATVAFADPAVLRLKNRELTCRESSNRLIKVEIETSLHHNVPCQRILMKDHLGRIVGNPHLVWGCAGKSDLALGVIRYDFDINDWPASITIDGENAILEKDTRAFPCSRGLAS